MKVNSQILDGDISSLKPVTGIWMPLGFLSQNCISKTGPSREARPLDGDIHVFFEF